MAGVGPFRCSPPKAGTDFDTAARRLRTGPGKVVGLGMTFAKSDFHSGGRPQNEENVLNFLSVFDTKVPKTARLKEEQIRKDELSWKS